MQQHTVRDVPRLLEQLRELVQSEMRKPPSAAYQRLSEKIELAAAQAEEPEVGTLDEWRALGLTRKEAEFAAFLKSRFGKPVSHDAIMSHMYGGSDDVPQPKMTNVLASKINTKLTAVSSPYCIEPAWGIGYKMVEGRHEKRSSEREEWRDGIFLGPQQTKAAELLFAADGKLVRTHDLAKHVGRPVNHLGSVMSRLRDAMAGSRFVIVNERRHGYRMTVKYPVN